MTPKELTLRDIESKEKYWQTMSIEMALLKKENRIMREALVWYATQEKVRDEVMAIKLKEKSGTFTTASELSLYNPLPSPAREALSKIKEI